MSENGNAPEKKLVSVTINGQTVEAEEGRMLIDIAEEMGVFVPRFCYHPGMKSVAVCRMCLVAVEGQNKLLPACATPVADEMKVDTVDEDAVDAQKGMLEFLLINHPLDCPVCDRGGECPLQDQTYQHGPGASRYIEPKRHFEKPLEISNLVVLDRERCVLCWRCVRFADEIAGDQFIQLVDRGAGTQILTFKDDPFDSYFSGNTIQICPVGALTSKPYRFVSRPWDLKSAPSVCTYCSVGCPITNESRSQKLVRCQALPNENVNDFWICDKGRYGYHHVDSDERLTAPLLRNDSDEFELATWLDATEKVAEKIKAAKNVGVIAGGHLTTEDAFAISRLASKVIKTPHIDSRIQDDGCSLRTRLEGRTGCRIDSDPQRSRDREQHRVGGSRSQGDVAGSLLAPAKGGSRSWSAARGRLAAQDLPRLLRERDRARGRGGRSRCGQGTRRRPLRPGGQPGFVLGSRIAGPRRGCSVRCSGRSCSEGERKAPRLPAARRLAGNDRHGRAPDPRRRLQAVGRGRSGHALDARGRCIG